MIKIGFSRTTEENNYQQYINWLKNIDSNFEYINFYNLAIPEAIKLLENCNGFVLTGGPDVHPSYYNKSDEVERCIIDLNRDKLEFALIDKALKLKLPILAICRGLQILNVSQGGSLIIDIESDYSKKINHKSGSENLNYHKINIEKSSEIFKKSKNLVYEVVTSHHQAIENLAPCFKATAFSEDKIIEAFEWISSYEKSPLYSVQWHPERGDYSNALNLVIGKSFINKVKKYK